MRRSSSMNVRPSRSICSSLRRAAVDPAERLPFHQLAKELDDRQDELRQTLARPTRGRRSPGASARSRAAPRRRRTARGRAGGRGSCPSRRRSLPGERERWPRPGAQESRDPGTDACAGGPPPRTRELRRGPRGRRRAGLPGRSGRAEVRAIAARRSWSRLAELSRRRVRADIRARSRRRARVAARRTRRAHATARRRRGRGRAPSRARSCRSIRTSAAERSSGTAVRTARGAGRGPP